jgi:selenophosphate synthase
VYIIAKGKDHKQYEYGNKVSIVSTKDNNIIVGVVSHDKNIHDSKTLERCNSLMSVLAMVLRRVKAFLALARFLTWRK